MSTDHLPTSLDPTGAVQTEQDACEWTRRLLTPDYYRTTCGNAPHMYAFRSWKFCPWCGKHLQIAKAEQ